MAGVDLASHQPAAHIVCTSEDPCREGVPLPLGNPLREGLQGGFGLPDRTALHRGDQREEVLPVGGQPAVAGSSGTSDAWSVIPRARSRSTST